eukprot:CAMPEP_0119109864 /NCGR_PEP_ID=MMETSP1180-20130426/24373_1 /TAXON_ID=3052 ORGANISM="Chlamydomonas cf sp, Strain CCMP681" /NCGR_SAMPLE_ID=MMETSP1180 /ASSEMBLY_ACC=CAM_ASM_000741 /LENGTH=522 /DNA_ID=CAMNT_0007095877 /DNA_START=95 /DNA_END=1660 /DNA_ORIENTATION=-
MEDKQQPQGGMYELTERNEREIGHEQSSGLPPLPGQPALPQTSGSISTGSDSANGSNSLKAIITQQAGEPDDPGKLDLDAKELNVDGEPAEPEGYADVTYWDIVKQFSILGWIAFGGPAAHIGLFQKRLVEKLRWMSTEVFLELFALGQCLPGPSSTQVSFAMGTVRKGVLGGLLSGALFQYPGAIIMTAVGVGAATSLADPAPWLAALTAGVSAVGVALVATAAKGLLMKMCNTYWLAIIGTLSAGAAIYWSPVWLFPLIIAVAGVLTIISNRNVDMSLKTVADDGVQSLGVGMKVGAALILVWAGVLTTVLVLVRSLDYDHRKDSTALDWFEVFYRTGSIIYGGGQVVLPLLLSDLVKYDCQAGRNPPCQEDLANSWMTGQQFYGGLGIVQAMPGPLFNLSAYLGAIIAFNRGQVFILGTVVAWFGLFGPGVMLMFAVLPFWKRFRKFQLYRRALPGMNAASVGLILASVFRMTVDVYALSPFPSSSLVIGLFAFTAVDSLQIFEPFVVIGGILLGLIGW